MSEQRQNNRQIDVLGNIYNNIKKGIDEGKTLISLQGSSRSGKTRNTVIWLCTEALQRPVKISIVRKSLPALKRSVLEDFKIVMMQMGQWEDKRFNKSENIYTFRNGSVIEFFSADDEQKVRGSSRDILFCNEANELLEAEFRQLRMRTRKYVIIDYNPSFTEEHWIYPLLTDRRTYHFISTFRDNIFLDPAIVEEIESYKETAPALWQIYGMGQFAIIEGLVYPKDNWDIIADVDFPDWKNEGFLGLDWGFKNDPSACVHVIISGKDVYVKEIFYELSLSTDDIADRLQDWKDVQKYCDIDNRLVTDLENAGIPLLTMTQKNSESIMTGIRLLNQRKIHVTEGSVDLIKELRNYVYKKDRHDIYQTKLKPIDKFNHLLDALRYVVYAEFKQDEIDNEDKYLSKYDLGFPI